MDFIQPIISLIPNDVITLCLLGTLTFSSIETYGEKFCVRFFMVQKVENNLTHSYGDRKYCLFKCFDNFQAEKIMTAFIMYNIAAAYLITILVFGKLYSFQNGEQ